jgi:kynurenine formamidase
MPAHLTQANTSKSNVLFSHSAPSTRGVLSFICSFLAAASLPALASSAWERGNSPGPGLDAAKYLVEKGARVVGADTLTFEKRPAAVYLPQLQLFPVHLLLVPDNGIYIIENVQLEALSRARAYEFVAVVPPLKVLGATGSALRAFALVGQAGR